MLPRNNSFSSKRSPGHVKSSFENLADKSSLTVEKLLAQNLKPFYGNMFFQKMFPKKDPLEKKMAISTPILKCFQ